MPDAFSFCGKSFIFSKIWFLAALAKKGWRRSLPDLIYNIQSGLVGHHKLALNARPMRDHHKSEKTCFCS